MEKTPAEMMKEYVNSQQFESTADVMAAMKELFADVVQRVMECELDNMLGYEKSQRMGEADENEVSKNYRNGYSKKRVKTQLGEVDIRVPRDRNGEYDPQIIGKYDRQRGWDGRKNYRVGCMRGIAAGYRGTGKGVVRCGHLAGAGEQNQRKIMPEVTAWQNRPLEAVYPFVFMDAIHYKVKENHRYITKAAYIVLGVDMDGHKDILGIWIGENESAKFWGGVLNDLKSRGVKDIYLFCVDGLSGFREAIAAAYPMAGIQRCIIHQIRSSTRYVSWKDIKALMADLKPVYQAVTEDEAFDRLAAFKENWGKQYPSCVKSWEDNWDILSTFYAYPPEIRRIIYTTNIIEELNRQFRKITKNKPSFTNDDSLKKMLYLASKKIVEHWTSRCRNWDQVVRHIEILFGDRIAG